MKNSESQPREEFVAPSQPEIPAAEVVAPDEPAPQRHDNGRIFQLVALGVLLVAVIVLYVLHFTGGKKSASETPSAPAMQVNTAPGNGNVLYVNLDSVYECKYFKQEMKVLEDEADKLKQDFEQRQAKLEADAAQFQKNIQSNILTEQQAQYAYEDLNKRSDQIQKDYQQALENLAQKQADLTNKLLDRLRVVVDQVNKQGQDAPNASYVITYSHDNPTLLQVDPSREITKNVIYELDKDVKEK